jgi:uncharacterized protein YndB with AHSA1/START domain
MSPIDPNQFDPGPLLQTSAEPDGDRRTVTMVRDLRHPPDKVWRALTDPSQLGQWAPFTADRDLGTEGDAVLTMIDGDTREDLPSKVTRAEPPKRLEYTWGDDHVSWQLDPTESGTRLILRHTVESAEWMPRVAAGWHLCLVVLDRLLGGDAIGPIVGQDAMNYGWQELHDAYAQKLN